MAGQGQKEADNKGSSLEDIESRLGKLGEKLDKVRDDSSRGETASGSIAKSHSQMGTAMRITSELIAPVLVSTFIGYWLDQYFETRPVLLILFFVIGVVTGFVNVVRVANKMQQETIESGAYKEAKDMPFDDDDD